MKKTWLYILISFSFFAVNTTSAMAVGSDDRVDMFSGGKFSGDQISRDDLQAFIKVAPDSSAQWTDDRHDIFNDGGLALLGPQWAITSENHHRADMFPQSSSFLTTPGDVFQNSVTFSTNSSDMFSSHKLDIQPDMFAVFKHSDYE